MDIINANKKNDEKELSKKLDKFLKKKECVDDE